MRKFLEASAGSRAASHPAALSELTMVTAALTPLAPLSIARAPSSHFVICFPLGSAPTSLPDRLTALFSLLSVLGGGGGVEEIFRD